MSKTLCCMSVNLKNAMVPLMMLLAAYDTDASANGINYHSHVATHFSSDLRNAMVSLMVLSRPHDADTNAFTSHYSNTKASVIT